MTLNMSVRKHLLLPLASLLAVVALAASVFSVPAHAIGNWGGNNPAYTWTTGNGVVYYYHWEWATVSSGPEDICVSPVQWNGSKWIFPYGWQCKNRESFFNHVEIAAAHGVYNPNGSRQYFNEAFE